MLYSHGDTLSSSWGITKNKKKDKSTSAENAVRTIPAAVAPHQAEPPNPPQSTNPLLMMYLMYLPGFHIILYIGIFLLCKFSVEKSLYTFAEICNSYK